MKERLDKLEDGQNDHGGRIVRVETLLESIVSLHAETVLELRNCVTAITKNTTEISGYNQERELINRRLEKQDLLIRQTHDEVVESRPVIKALAGLGKKLIGFSLTIIVAAVAVIIAMKGS